MTLGIFDSGVGGFSVVRPLLARFPEVSMIYVADTAHVPYSNKTKAELEEIVGRILAFLLQEKVDAVLFACNTSSALILPQVRSSGFPVPVYGVVEPGVAAALEMTNGKGIGVIANEVTAKSGVFSRLIREKNPDVPVYEVSAPLLVPIVELGAFDSEEAKHLVEKYCAPVRGKIDTLLWACTHFPFLREHFRNALPGVKLVDPADRLLEDLGAVLGAAGNAKPPSHRLLATRDPAGVAAWVERVLTWGMSARLLDLGSVKPWRGTAPQHESFF